MLSRGKRLDRANFSRVANGKRAISAHFSVSVAPSSEGRAAAVISKKVAKKSVDRHTLKRRILDVTRRHLAPGRAFIVYARSGSPSLPFSELKKELELLLSTLPRV